MHRAFQLGKSPDVTRRHLEEHLSFEPSGGDHVPQQVDDILPLRGDLHFDDRVIQQVAPVVRRSAAQVVRCPQGEQLHGSQAGVGVHEHLAHVREVGHRHAVQPAVGGVGDGFVEGVCADADRSPSQVVLADIDRVKTHVPGVPADRQGLVLAHRVVVQSILPDIVLAVGHVADQLVLLITVISDEKDILSILRHLAKGRDHAGQVGVADVVFLAVGQVAAIRLPGQCHFRRVDVRPVFALGQPEGEHAAFL